MQFTLLPTLHRNKRGSSRTPAICWSLFLGVVQAVKGVQSKSQSQSLRTAQLQGQSRERAVALGAESLAETTKTPYSATFKALKELYDQITNTSKLFNFGSKKTNRLVVNICWPIKSKWIYCVIRSLFPNKTALVFLAPLMSCPFGETMIYWPDCHMF